MSHREPDSLRQASVLVPVYRDPSGALRLVMVVRGEGGTYGGQISFPGGGREPHDSDALATALREAEEEIGLSPRSVTLLETLPTLVTRNTRIQILPFLVRIVRPDAWRPDPLEIAEVIEPTVTELLNPDAQGASMESLPGWPGPMHVEFIRLGKHRLWGATHRIVTPLLPRLNAGDWAL